MSPNSDQPATVKTILDTERTILLRKPVTFAEQIFDRLELREPTAGELEKASSASTNLGVVINLISAVAQVPRRVVEGLSQRDLKEAGDFLDSFNKDDPTTGATSLPN